MHQDQPTLLNAKMPFIEKTFNSDAFTKFILNSKDNFTELNQSIRSCKGTHTSIRFSIWRLLTGVFTVESTAEEKLVVLQAKRDEYQQLINKFMKKEDQITKVAVKKDPLSRDAGTGNSTNYYENQDLRNTIKMDIQRTYQEIQFFEHPKIKNLLVNVLFIWSKNNASISYIQGMNEIAASLVYTYFQECLGVEVSELYENNENQTTILKFQDVNFAEADIYSVFKQVMNDGQHMEMFRPNYTEKQRVLLGSKKPSPILNRISKLQDQYLKIVDIELFRHIKLLDVELRVFLLRWFRFLDVIFIRCMFTREFTLIESFTVWDAIFLEFQSNPLNNNLAFIDCISLAMMSFVRAGVLEQDETSQCYQKFLKYPQIANIQILIDTAFLYKEMLNEPERALQIQEQTSQLFLGGKTPLTIDRDEPQKLGSSPLIKVSPKKVVLLIPSTVKSQNQNSQSKNDSMNKTPFLTKEKSSPLPTANVNKPILNKQEPVKSNEQTSIILQLEEVQIIIKALQDGLSRISETGNNDILKSTKDDIEEIKLMLEKEVLSHHSQIRQKRDNGQFY